MHKQKQQTHCAILNEKKGRFNAGKKQTIINVKI